MINNYIFYIFLLTLKIIITDKPYCTTFSNHCTKCNPLTNLCISCDLDIFTPDDKGGCSYSRKCIPDNNYCKECNTEGKICEKCEEGYFPDDNGGCSYTSNCNISLDGECLICKEDYILIGRQFDLIKELKICKSINSDDFKNCKTINTIKGICKECEEGFYLNSGDNRCTKTENCYESVFGVCIKCNNFYYLNKLEDKCIWQNNNLLHCLETLDGKTCNLCEDNYHLDENGKCIWINFCKEEDTMGRCKLCIDGYFLALDGSCTTEKNCYSGYKDLGICNRCIRNYYIDFKDGKCKSNLDNDNFIYCIRADEICIECDYGIYLGLDNKCSYSKYCAESEKGICIECKDGFYLGLDNYCTNVEKCLYSNYYDCIECEENYYFDRSVNLCKEINNNFTNCKYTYDGINCERCHNNYYLNQSDYLCYPNDEPGDFYKCLITDENATVCSYCIDDYYLGHKDNKCSKIFGCELSENENKCLECNYLYCLNQKTGNCEDNEEINKEEEKIFFRCSRTNDEGNACEICVNNFTLNENGLCIDENYCIERDENGKCLKCINNEYSNFCLNDQFECVETFSDNCLECNNIFNFDKCTKCFDGFELDENGNCV